MAQFHMKIAGVVACVQPLFESTAQYFRAYLTDADADFSITVTPADLLFEQAELDREAVEEGFRHRVFTDPFLERATIQRGFALHLLRLDTLLIHGSAIAVDGQGYLFIARSGTGKSTHTRLWRELFGPRAQMINDDKPFVTVQAGRALLHGSPWSGKHGLDSNLSVALAGICLLERGEQNILRPMEAEEMLPALRKHSFCPPEAWEQSQFLQLTERLSRAAPLWHMACNKHPQAAQAAYRTMCPQGPLGEADIFSARG